MHARVRIVLVPPPSPGPLL